MNEWGLTEQGFKRPTYTDLLDAYEIRAKELFGSTINLSVRSPLGIFLRIFAWFSGLIFQLAEDVYNSGHIDTADGISLFRMGKFIGTRQLSAQKAVGKIDITGDPGAVVRAGFLVSAHNNTRFVTLENVTLDANGAGSVSIQAFVTGPDGNVAAGAITDIVTPQANVSAVINPKPLTGGRDSETPAEFRNRYQVSTDLAGGSNTDAIRAELLRVDAVQTATVFENIEDFEDEQGLPPHSIECIVYGGYDADIANAIFIRKAAGIQTHGNTSDTLLDASGLQKIIRFSRPDALPIWVRITNLQADSAFKGNESIISALCAFVGGSDGLLSGGLPIGADVIYNKLVCPVNNVSGVVDYLLEVSTDGETWSRDNIAIGPRAKAVLTPDRVVFA